MKLNEKQLEAIAHKEGLLLIVAGAGSGKTTVLVERTDKLIKEHKADPENILFVTFLNKAVHELEKRIKNKVGNEGDKIFISTFHGLGREVLTFYKKQDIAVTHTYKSRQLVKESIEELDIKGETPSHFMKIISLMKSELVLPEFLEKGQVLKEWIDTERVKDIIKVELKTTEKYKHFKQVYKRYQEKLERENLIDVDDLLLLAVNHLINHPSDLEKIQNRFRYIMVDEYQDTNRAQYILIKLLANKEKNLVVVGDDSQSIYRFRGSDMRNILTFLEDYPEAKEIVLEQNYRSTRIILQAANQLIHKNKEQREKALYTDQEDGSKIKLIKAKNTLDEAEKVAKEIKRILAEESYEPRDIAVFYRNNADSTSLQTVFPNEEVPFVLSSEASFFDRKEINDVLNYLQFLLNPSDAYLFSTIINQPKRGIGNTSVSQFIQANRNENFISFVKHQNVVKLNKNAIEGMKGFIQLMDTYTDKIKKESSHQLITQLIEDIQYKESFSNLETYIRKEKEDYLNKLIDLAKEMEIKKGSTLFLHEFIQQLLKTDVDQHLTEDEFNKVNLLTVHGAKGLEFPIVFIIGMKEEGFPSKYALTETAIEEERRLAHVGFTRAKEHLYLSYPKTSLVKDENNPKEKIEVQNRPSRFLSEFDSSLMEEIK